MRFLLIFTAVFSGNFYCQIDIRENVREEYFDKSVVPNYDSLSDFGQKERHIEYLQYIGQELFLPPIAGKLAFATASGIQTRDQGNYHLKIDKSKLIYNSKYKILDITSAKQNLRNIPPTESVRRLTIKIQDSLGNIAYLEKDLVFRDKSLYPFILNGFYLKSLKRHRGKEMFVYKEPRNKQYIDINTGQGVDLETGTFWVCDGISFIKVSDADTYRPFYILKNDAVEIKVKLEELSESGLISLDELNIMYKAWLAQKHEEEKNETQKREAELRDCIKYFSAGICDKLVKGEIEIGMTKDMIQYAIGPPYETFFVRKQNVDREIFSYGSLFLYFDGNKLSTIKGYR